MRMFSRKVIGIGLLVLSSACARERWQTYSATAYSVEGETASGAQTVEGRTVAADPRILAAGTQIEIRGAGEYSGRYIVQDTGPAIRGREIDIFIDNPVEAKKFGRQEVKLRVIKKPLPSSGQSAAKR